jgi:dienelactone hydrolase
VLRACIEVDPERIATAGFSGGGARVAHLLACSDRLRAGVITASMSTYADIADGRADDTSWLMITPGLPAVCDWPEIAGSAAPTPLLVQFAKHDSHFGTAGMREAEASLRRDYGDSKTLFTQWFSEPHRFTTAMQDAAASWLSLHV